MRYIDYRHEGVAFQGYLASQPALATKGAILVVPTWLNLDDGIIARAEAISRRGYIVLVADLFGRGVRPRPPQQPLEVAGLLLSDRRLFRGRLFAALEALLEQPECQTCLVAAVGYCLGGCGVLELARAGADLQGVVSLHGILASSLPAVQGLLKAKVLVLHGDDDPLVPIEDLLAFREEMRLASANWQLTIYGDARHSFTGEGTLGGETSKAGRHPQSDSRAWNATLSFLAEVTANTH